jgi:hypothetical protein
VLVSLVGMLGFLSLALLGCGVFESACVGVGFGDACSTPEGPASGPWRAVAQFSSDTCGIDDGSWAEGWTIARSGDAFDLDFPAGGATSCALDGATFTCEDAEYNGLTVALDGAFDSASTGAADLSVQGASCASTASLRLRAAWHDGLSPVDGACPDNFGTYSVPEGGESVAYTIFNRTDAAIGLYELTTVDPVYAGDIAPNTSISANGRLDGYFVLGNGSDESACRYFFRLTEAGQQVVWDG